ncbi:SdpI family protein [Microbacterium sp. No. 7]|uniref:SdpI family protein n=1 Tax=Microbacterium sp. No. 7 TaxID=1714373 RepID=UPI0006D0AE62|nr:SdpI family protein [Microbacterium sp. No. 7]
MAELIGAALVAALALLVLWWARACRRGTFRRSRIAGYRTALTLRDDHAWVAVHRAASPFLAVAGVGALVGTIAGAVLALAGVAGAAAALGASVAWVLPWVLLWALLGLIPAVRAERAYRRR